MMRRWLIAGIGIALCATALMVDRADALAAYLCAWLFVLGLSLGGMALWMTHALTGGRWFVIVRDPLAGEVRAMWLVALLFLPLLAMGFHSPGPWSSPPVGGAKGPPGWIAPHALALRSVIYLAIWTLLAALWQWVVRRHRRVPGGLAAFTLIVYLLSITAAAFDWVATLQPGWFSSGLGLVVAAAQALGAMALAIAAGAARQPQSPGQLRRDRLNDLGNLMLTLVMLWAYLEFMQLLIVWSENLPREIGWYLPRWQTSWSWVGGALAAVQFGLPMALLLVRTAKRSPRALATLTTGVLVANFAYVAWLILPTLRRHGIELHVVDALAAAGVIGIWMSYWWSASSSAQVRRA